MKKILLLLFVLLVGCSPNDINISNSKVYIDFKAVDTIVQNNEIYIRMDSLEKLEINILEDVETNSYYLSKGEISLSLSNERPYSWYIDQGDTGIYGSNNCGPSASVMAGLWQNKDFKYTPQEARVEFRPSGGW